MTVKTTAKRESKSCQMKTSAIQRLHRKDPKLGIGGAPTRATTLPENGVERKKFPIGEGVLSYFPDAIVAIARVSYEGNQQHNAGQPLHWARDKSRDEADTMIRHFLERGTVDVDGAPHTAKMAWRSLAYLQKEIEDHPEMYKAWYDGGK